MTEPMKRCRQCGQIKPLTEFVRTGKSSYAYDDPRAHKPRCSICEITNRTVPKADRRERHKARDTRARHARKFGISLDDMEQFYGWELDRIEADIIAVATTVCPDCNVAPLGLADIHIDIRDPTEPPFYGVNTRVVCSTCNRRKGPRSEMRRAIEEAERQAIVRRASRPKPPQQLGLFEP
jgi:hypothetical protein